MCLATIEAAAAALLRLPSRSDSGEDDPPPTPGPLLLSQHREEEEEAGLGIWNPSTAAPSCRRADAARKPRRADRSCMGSRCFGGLKSRGTRIEFEEEEAEEEVRRRSEARGEGGD
jgi:hypothetical protein